MMKRRHEIAHRADGDASQTRDTTDSPTQPIDAATVERSCDAVRRFGWRLVEELSGG